MISLLGLNGSLRSGSFSRRVLLAAGEMLGDQVNMTTYDIGTLPLFNEDLETDKPASVLGLIDAIERADALLIVTPEYNYAMPGVLKNAIDWASRPSSKSCLAHKPTAIMASSISFVGGARALANLKQVLSSTVSDVFPHPEVLVSRVQEKFSDQGLTDQATKAYLEKFLGSFVGWLKQRKV